MTKNIQQSLPAEWSAQSGIMLTWPHDQGDWGERLPAIEQNYLNIVRHISHFEKVLITCRDELHRQHIKRSLALTDAEQSRLSFYIAPSNDVWVRDYGPLTVLKANKPVLYKFTFNAWGNKYSSELDNAIVTRLYNDGAFGEIELQTSKLILEGGSIEVNGEGTLLTTTNCLLSPLRNPQLDCDLIEAMLEEVFGIEHFLWLKHGELQGDDTDGHIDTIARFTDANTILYVSCNNENDPNFNELKNMEAELQAFCQPDGRPYNLVALPSPEPKQDSDGRQLPATYANFLIINDAVLVPVYDDPADNVALDVIKSCFPDRKIIGINCLALVEQNGSLHCATMQLPVGVI
ncbi:MAG: agmatine deiminase family protein [Gammaproteobacteria bacterium]|nr:agmatine deiminase family protein [Gammaproteobacteria bacterium]